MMEIRPLCSRHWGDVREIEAVDGASYMTDKRAMYGVVPIVCASCAQHACVGQTSQDNPVDQESQERA